MSLIEAAVDEPGQALQILARRYGLPSSELRARLETMRTTYAEDLSLELAEPASEALAERFDLTHVTLLTSRVDRAALLLSAAFAKAGVEDFRPLRARNLPVDGSIDWYHALVTTSLMRLRDVRNALVHRWTPSPDADALVLAAFAALAELTPVRCQLLHLFRVKRQRACEELGDQLDVLADQFRLTIRLVTEVEAGELGEHVAEEGPDEAEVADLLAQAGDTLSLTQVAGRMRVTRQALHQRVKKGGLLAIMRDGELRLPAFQFEIVDGHMAILRGVPVVLAAFREEREWAAKALRFLVTRDATLGCRPADALAAGASEAVAAAARAACAEGGCGKGDIDQLDGRALHDSVNPEKSY